MMLLIRMRSLSYEEYRPFSLDDMDSSECKADFRLEKEDIPVLANLFYVFQVGFDALRE